MGSKKVLWFVGVLALFAVGIVTADWFSKNKGRAGSRQGQAVLAPELAATATELRITSKDGSLVIAKAKSGEWLLPGQPAFPADAGKVVGLWDQLATNKLQNRLTMNASAREDYGLVNPAKIIVMTDSKELLNLSLGDARPGGGQYIEIGEGDAYLIRTEFRIPIEPAEWETKVLLSIPKDQIKKIEYFDPMGQKTAGLVREKKEDKLTVEGTLKKGENITLNSIDGAEGVLTKLVFTNRLDLSNESAKSAMIKSYKTVVELFSGKVVEIMTGENGSKENMKYYVKITGSAIEGDLAEILKAWSFEVPSHVAKDLQKKRRDFIAI